MANHPVPALDVPADDRASLSTWSRTYVLPQRLVTRSRIVLLASEGLPNRQIAARVGTTLPTVKLRRSRYQQEGLAALEVDRPGRGRPKVLGEKVRARIISVTLSKPLRGHTHWSSREVAKEVGVNATTVLDTWREEGLKPHRTRGFKYSTDPELEAKVIAARYPRVTRSGRSPHSQTVALALATAAVSRASIRSSMESSTLRAVGVDAT